MPIRSYTVGQSNTILRRDDHTGPWIDIAPTAPQFNGTHWRDVMAFPGDPDKVVAVGSISGGPNPRGLIVSTDAGVTWNTPTGNWPLYGKYFKEVWVVDANVIWIVGEGGAAVKSTDGGLSFNNPDPFNNATKPGGGLMQATFAIHAISADIAVVAGSPVEDLGVNEAFVWKTIDGGNSWFDLNTGSTYLSPAVPSLRNAQVNSVLTLDLSSLPSGTGYPASAVGVPTSTSGNGTGCTLSFGATAGVIQNVGITAGGQDYQIGDTLTILDGNNDCVVTIIAINAGAPTGVPDGIWISNDQQRIVVGTNYTQQLSIDGGNTFVPVAPEVTRSGLHLTWYPSHDPAPSHFRHTGGPQFHVVHSTDIGTSWTLERSGEGIQMQGAHFYSPQNGYYLVLNQIWSTSNGGVTGDAATYTDPQNLQLESVWTEEPLPVSTEPCYRFTPCDPQVTPTIWTGGVLTQFNGQVVDADFPTAGGPSNIICGVFSEIPDANSCHDQQVTIETDAFAGQIHYTDCDGVDQIIDYPATITNALVFNFCSLDGTPIVTTGTVVELDPCGGADLCADANAFSPNNTVLNTYADCDTCLGPAPSFPCYNLISCTPETCPDILYATDVELAPFVGQYIEINGDSNCRYLVQTTRQGYFTSGLNPLILSNPAGDFQLGTDDYTLQVTSVVVNGTEYVPGLATPYILTPVNYQVVECTDLSCVTVPANTTENCVTNLPTYLNNVFANSNVPELIAECADPAYCEDLLNTFLCKIQYSQGTTFSITFTIQNNAGTLTYVYSGVGGNVTGLEITDSASPPSVINVLTCNSQSECTGKLVLDTTQPILNFTECVPVLQPEIGEACVVRPRFAEPGFSTKYCNPEQVVDINCKFGDSVYALFKRMRYGIETCCEYDLDKIEIKKDLMDLGALYDPDMCIPGQPVPFGCCPQPCDVTVELAIPQFVSCEEPENVTAIIDVPFPFQPVTCDEPAGITDSGEPIVTIALEPLPVPACNAYEVTIPISTSSNTIAYTDCNGTPQVIAHPAVSDAGPPLVYEFCALEGFPITTVGSIVEVNICTGDCYNTLYEITIPPSAFGSSYTIYYCNGPSVVGIAPSAGIVFTVCASSTEPPTFGTGGSWVNLGQCP
jgi:photosystem II stability/assembly factor-like uncharacterized protein